MSDLSSFLSELETLLTPPGRFHTRKMFGGAALYADAVVVALVGDGELFVKIAPQTAAYEGVVETGYPYEGAKLHYVFSDVLYDRNAAAELSERLLALAQARKK